MKKVCCYFIVWSCHTQFTFYATKYLLWKNIEKNINTIMSKENLKSTYLLSYDFMSMINREFSINIQLKIRKISNTKFLVKICYVFLCCCCTGTKVQNSEQIWLELTSHAQSSSEETSKHTVLSKLCSMHIREY